MIKIFKTLSLFLLMIPVVSFSQTTRQEITTPSNFEVSIQEEIQKCRSGKQNVINFPKGIYHIYSDRLSVRTLHLSNNDDGEKNILFDLSDIDNVTIEGNGAEIIMHGNIIPFFMEGAKNITIKNLIIDWANPFYAQAVLTDSGKNWFECKFQKEYPIKVKNGKIYFLNPDLRENMSFCNINFIDPKRDEQAYKSKDEYPLAREYKAIEKENGVIRIESKVLRSVVKAGYIAVFQYKGRTTPAIVVQRGENITISDVTMYSSGAMGCLFEGTKDIYINKLNIIRRPESGRYHTAHHDAIHYVDCRGNLFVKNCEIEFQGDDAINIHGAFRTVTRVMGKQKLQVGLNHFQQMGLNTIFAGDNIGFYDANTLKFLAEAKVASAQKRTAQEFFLTFENELPSFDDWTNIVLAPREHNTHVDISKNRFTKNRARGLLIKTLGKVRIYENYFHNPGAAIKFRIDANNWYESGPVDDVEIYNNIFDQCNFGTFSRALFEIDPGLNDRYSKIPVFKNVSIHDNKIIQIYKPLIVASNIEEFEFYDNEILQGKDYEHFSSDKKPRDYKLGIGVTFLRLQDLSGKPKEDE